MKHKYIAEVATLKLDQEKCKGCGMCQVVCPHRVFEMRDMKVRIVNKNSCMECGACAKNCPFSAIEVDASVGCAAAILMGMLTGKEPTCGCADEEGCC